MTVVSTIPDTKKFTAFLALGLIFAGGDPARAASPTAPTPATVSSPDRSPAALPINDSPKLRVEGNQLKDANGRVVVLRGAAVIGLEDSARYRGGSRFVIDLLTDPSKGWHANFIRLPVFPGHYLRDPAGYVARHLQPAVDLCAAKRIYCIIDWHYFANPYNLTAQSRQFWTDMASRYKDHPYLIFEIFNEPITGGSGKQAEWDKWKNWAQDIVDLIRSQAPDNIVLVGGPHFSSHLRGALSNPVNGANIAYAGHIYPGGYYPHANGANSSNPAHWEYQIGVVADHHPVIITEWGYGELKRAETKGTMGSFGAPFKAWADSRNLSWTAWVADWDWYPAMFNRNYTTTEFGSLVKEWLKPRS